MKELQKVGEDTKLIQEPELQPKTGLRNSYHSNRSGIVIQAGSNDEVIKTLSRVAVVCLIFMIIELIGGYWANSVAVISDALHLSVDLVGYAIQITSAYLAMKSR